MFSFFPIASSLESFDNGIIIPSCFAFKIVDFEFKEVIMLALDS